MLNAKQRPFDGLSLQHTTFDNGKEIYESNNRYNTSMSTKSNSKTCADGRNQQKLNHPAKKVYIYQLWKLTHWIYVVKSNDQISVLYTYHL